MTTITIIPPSRWQPYTVVDTHAVGLEVHRAIQAALRTRGVASETSGESLRWAIGTANGHSFGVYGDLAEITGLLQEVGRDLGFGVEEQPADPDGLSPEDRRVADRIAAMPVEPLAEGAEERMLERVRTSHS